MFSHSALRSRKKGDGMKTKTKQKQIRCEGYRRLGGAFTLGPSTWTQCKNKAIVSLLVKQNGKTQRLPACQKCWNESIATGIAISGEYL